MRNKQLKENTMRKKDAQRLHKKSSKDNMLPLVCRDMKVALSF
jgi:hypothetical protein